MVYPETTDPEVALFVIACGGNDVWFDNTRRQGRERPREDCRGLAPAFTIDWDDDGKLFVAFGARKVGTATLYFSYPGPSLSEARWRGQTQGPTEPTHVVTVDVTVCDPCDPAPAPPPPVEVVLPPIDPITVKRLAGGGTESFPGFVVVGDHQVNGDRTLQGFVTFDVSKISGVIEKATIQVTRNPAFEEGNPFSTLGGLYVEGATGVVLNDGSLQPDAILISSGPFDETPVDVTALVQAAVDAGRSTLVLRFRFEKPEDVPSDGENDSTDLTIDGIETAFRP